MDVPTPGPGEALVRSGAIGMCGTDYHAYDGNQNFFTFPRVLGHELGVTIESFGDSEVEGFAVGDKCAVVPYWECGNCVACKWDKPNCCREISVIGVHADGNDLFACRVSVLSLPLFVPTDRIIFDAQVGCVTFSLFL